MKLGYLAHRTYPVAIYRNSKKEMLLLRSQRRKVAQKSKEEVVDKRESGSI